METAELVARLDGQTERTQVAVEGGRIVLRTGERVVAGERRRAAAIGILAALAGGGLFLVSPWFAAVAAAGVAYAVAAPRRVRPLVLATVDAEAECLVGSNAVPLARIRAIRGAFETKGWDGFSVISATLDDGSSAPVVLLLGADERLAEEVCAQLGRLVRCPAEYTGTSGRAIVCWSLKSSNS